MCFWFFYIVSFAFSNIGFSSTASDDTSYSIGYLKAQQIKQQLNSNNISVDYGSMIDGLNDGIQGKKAKLTEDQMRQAVTYLTKK